MKLAPTLGALYLNLCLCNVWEAQEELCTLKADGTQHLWYKCAPFAHFYLRGHNLSLLIYDLEFYLKLFLHLTIFPILVITALILESIFGFV